jgi:hypothetical protein
VALSIGEIMKKLFFIIGTVTMVLTAQAKDIGELVKTRTGLKVNINQQFYEIIANKNISKYIESYEINRSKFIFFGEVKNNKYHMSKTPQIISSKTELSGLLTKNENKLILQTENQAYNINFTTPVSYYGNHFDDKSINFFLGKNVRVLGSQKENEITVSAILEQHLYSASNIEGDLLPSSQINDYNSNRLSYIFENMQTNELAQSLSSFREVLIGDNEVVSPGEKALVVTYAGRQGDDLAAAGGHFAVGSALVKGDLSLDMEIQNFYPRKNEKDIIPGHIHHLDYFGGVSTGQANYRPQWTIIAYGIDKDRLDRMRAAVDFTYDFIRSNDNVFSTFLNCTTSSWNALKSIGINGVHNRGTLRRLRYLAFLNPMYHLRSTTSTPRQISYVLAKSKGEFLPRAAFESAVSDYKSIGAKRIDIIFHQQLISGRPQGGTAYNELKEYFWWEKAEKQRILESRSVEWVKEQLDNNID